MVLITSYSPTYIIYLIWSWIFLVINNSISLNSWNLIGITYKLQVLSSSAESHCCHNSICYGQLNYFYCTDEYSLSRSHIQKQLLPFCISVHYAAGPAALPLLHSYYCHKFPMWIWFNSRCTGIIQPPILASNQYITGVPTSSIQYQKSIHSSVSNILYIHAITRLIWYKYEWLKWFLLNPFKACRNMHPPQPWVTPLNNATVIVSHWLLYCTWYIVFIHSTTQTALY